MFEIIEKAALLCYAAAIIAICSPQDGKSISLAKNLNNSIPVHTTTAANTNSPDKATPKTKPSEMPNNPRKFKATAYALRGHTKSGAKVKRGLIAADPRLLPLGTKVHIAAGDWSGVYLVADTGGVIRGEIVDIWVPNSAEARRFGRRQVSLTVLGR